MIRTQIYLTEKEKNILLQLTHQTKQTQSELIREAIDHLALRLLKHKNTALEAAAGLWAKRKDLPAFAKLRESWDR